MKPDVTVIADDLTGAADCGIAFAIAGLPTYIAFAADSTTDSAQVLVIDIDSRPLSPAAAAARSRAAAVAACRNGSRVIYKKIDSTLRGHVGVELAATCDAVAAETGRSPLAIVAPAFPIMGRTTANGRVLIHGTPLDQTEVWTKSGMTGPADLVPMLRVAGLEAGVAAHPGEIPALFAKGTRAIICDAATEQDLRQIAEAGAKISVPIVWVGSGGLARHLATALGLKPTSSAAHGAAWPAGPVLTLVGSRSSIAREQARRLSAEPGVESMVLAPAILLAGEGHESWRNASEIFTRTLQSGHDVVISISLEGTIDLSQSTPLAAALGRFAAPHVDKLGGLVATGGETAKAMLTALGARGTFLLGEVEAGVPYGLADLARPLPLATKSGAFGTPAALQRCRAALKRRNS